MKPGPKKTPASETHLDWADDDDLLDLIGRDMLMSFCKTYMNGPLDVEVALADLIAGQNGLADSVIRMAGNLRYSNPKRKHRPLLMER